MSYYSENASSIHMPKVILMGIEGLNEGVLQLQYETGLYLDGDESLATITRCIQKEDIARSEIEYYCLDMVNRYCNGTMYIGLDILLKFLIAFGTELFYRVREAGFYSNGVFPYTYDYRRFDSIRFLRSDIYIDEIKRELADEGLYTWPRLPGLKNRGYI